MSDVVGHQLAIEVQLAMMALIIMLSADYVCNWRISLALYAIAELNPGIRVRK